MGPFGPTFSGGVRAADLVLADGATGVLAYNDDVAAGWSVGSPTGACPCRPG